MVFRVFGATPRCFPHVVDTDMLFSAVFSMFLDSNLPTTPSVNWKMCFVFGLWLQKNEENIINHTCMELSGTKNATFMYGVNFLS